MYEGEGLKNYSRVKFYGAVSIKENVKIGEGTKIGEFVVIGANARIGRNCSILYFVSICKDAVIEDEVFLGPGVRLLNDKYPPTKVSHPPLIEEGAIIGGGAIITPGVRIGKRAVVGAGSTVTRDVPAEAVVVGDAAELLMSRDDYDRKQGELKERHI